MLLVAQLILIFLSSLFQVNEYLKETVAQEQRKKETQGAEPAGSPRVGVLFFLFFSHRQVIHKHINIWWTVSNKLSKILGSA